jgi:hypothetical protein
MSRRLSRFLPPGATDVGPASCADCGVGSLTVFYTSKEENLHLCPACFESRVKRGLARQTAAGES